ncbi:MAG TPA: branched-chain amino acid ABC transporter substrate-binding protein [Solirubrobacteraceae bacterium]|nr:branched-chain amino acid ABC transporter substrate-binding protein [Solirubrobacteraceae bacterium]
MRVLRWSMLAIGGLAIVFGLAACGKSSKKKSAGASKAVSGTSLTIYSSLPLQGASGPQSQAIVNGAKLAVSGVGGKVDKYSIKYSSLDDSTAAAGKADDATVGANARKAVSDSSTIAYLGEYNSGATKISLPILNKASIAQVSPSNTYVGLTTNKPGSEAGEPGKYYPAGTRTYARVVPTDIIQGAAIAAAAKADGCKSLHIWNTQTTYSSGLARNLSAAAKKIGMKVEGNDGIDPKAPNYRSLAASVHSDCFAFTGEIESNGVQAVKDVGTSHPNIKLYGGDGVVTNEFASTSKGLPASVGARFKGTIATLDPAKFAPAGKKFFKDYEKTYRTRNPDPYAIYGFESMALLLDSVKRAAASGTVTRAAVAKALLSTKDRNSVLGTYSIDKNGDTTLTDYGLYKVVRGKLKFDKVIKATK